MYDARLLLEPEALARAVAAGHDWRSAHDALARADAAPDQAERSLANRDFHRELYAGCGNPLLVRMLDDLRDQTALVSAAAWRHEPAFPALARAGSTRRPNTGASCRPPKTGDAQRAAALLRAHITSFVDRNFPATPETPHLGWVRGRKWRTTDEPHPGRGARCATPSPPPSSSP